VLLLLLGAPLDTLIDREHGLPSWYDPGVNEEAMQAWEILKTAAESEGLKLILFSEYRSYEYQVDLYDNEVQKRGEQANLYSARPGHSEHQLGTALDVTWPGVKIGTNDPRNASIYSWLEANAHLFGFVLSFPYKVDDKWPFHNRSMFLVTEFIYEPWHIRYVGVDLAQRIYDAGYLDPASPVIPQDFYRQWP
jgi:D-alanyl-D-alanine carboxypeptidase